ncbi:MAG: ABC transporter permease subunit, partial [Chloroflexi bacterium]|nr:ABC transporter permease subunit [Chloroflexota bacterium]
RQMVQKQLTQNSAYTVSEAEHRRERRQAWVRSTLGNAPFVLGSLILLALLGAIALGPYLAPHSPYATQSLSIADGKISVPPFPPSARHPWGTDVIGRDIMSLIIAGAQRTVTMALLIVLARLAIGASLGAVAGWYSGGRVDRLILGLAETIAAFPSLLLAMLLVLALGIRNGAWVFVAALCFVGWGEVMQFVRSEVQAIRPRPYIESAIAAGLRTPQILYRHILPNLISPLIALAALEMGAVLMLLGELGFLGIFIGGGAYRELEYMMPPYHYSDVPEWAALLSNVRRYARAYTWTALYPAGAFFVAILGFNLFGEGLRRLVEGVGAGFTRLLNRTTLAFTALALLATAWVQGNVTPVSYWTRQAQAFDAQRAMAAIHYLTSEALDGRALGTPGIHQAAAYLAEQYKALGWQAAGEPAENTFTYFQGREFTYFRLDAVPTLEVDDGGAPLRYRHDLAAYPGQVRSQGQASGLVTWVGMGVIEGTTAGRSRALAELNVAEQVVLVLSHQAAAHMASTRRAGLLVVTEDPELLRKGITLAGRDPCVFQPTVGRSACRETPALWISEAAANRLLAPTGRTVASLRAEEQRLAPGEVVRLATPTQVRLAVSGSSEARSPAEVVLAHLPGTYYMGESKLDHEMILVLATYDGFGRDADGALYPGANNASAAALMLEVA